MKQYVKYIFVLAAIFTSCTEYELHGDKKTVVVPEESPDISVYPTHIDFGSLNADGDIASEVIVITNDGLDTLNLDNLEMKVGSSVFSLSSLAVGSLEPDEKTELTFTYDPETYSSDSDSIVIYSNDPDEHILEIPIVGEGAAPVIDISPEEQDMGMTLVGCENEQIIKISNFGNVDLEITSVNYFVSYPADLSISTEENINGFLPWIIPPGDSKMVKVYHNPMDSGADSGFIEIESNDPFVPVAVADQDAFGDYTATFEERFEQEEIDSVDVLFVVDNSGSMGFNQINLLNNFNRFLVYLTSSGVSYNIAFITTDDHELVGPVINSMLADPLAEALTQIGSIGTRGSAHEQGFQSSHDALQAGGPAGDGGDFFRRDAKLVIIYVSDEDDRTYSHTPATMSSFLWSLKSDTTLVVAHAIAGDVPGGCSTNGGADEALEYFDLVGLMGGTFLSICEDDWSTPMESLATASIVYDTFFLTETPLERTIQVFVNGVEESGWVYNSSDNSIVFERSAIPYDGDDIIVEYATLAECIE